MNSFLKKTTKHQLFRHSTKRNQMQLSPLPTTIVCEKTCHTAAKAVKQLQIYTSDDQLGKRILFILREKNSFALFSIKKEKLCIIFVHKSYFI